jgi:transglutaminase-like putative cysteine protease
MIYSVSHTTEYIYDDYVNYCHSLATLKPRETPGQHLLEYAIEIEPVPGEISERIDFFGNHVTRFSIQHPHQTLTVTSKAKIARNYGPYLEAFQTDACKGITLQEATREIEKIDPDVLEARQFMLESAFIRKFSNQIRAYASGSFQPERSVFEAGFELMNRIYSDFTFVAGFTNVATPLNDVIREKKGVCQDFAQIAIACIRSVGLPARYVSGYIDTVAPAGKEKLTGADASHAWFSMYIPRFGWVDFDPTNNLIPEDRHIIVGWGRDYYDVPPLKGVIFSNGKHTMKVAVDIQRIK